MRLWVLAVFAAALVVALIATAPLRLALGWARIETAGFSAAAVEGPVWNGRAQNARLGGLDLGEARIALDPIALVLGARKARVSASGEVQGDGFVVLSPRAWGVERLSGSLPFARLGLTLPAGGRLRAENLDALMGPDGCVRARGRIATDALGASAAGLQWQGPELAGEAQCAADGAIEAPLTGTDGRSTVTALLRMYADGRFSLETRIAASDPSVAAALQAGGFTPGPNGFARLDEGRLADVVGR